jgi:glycosyltransferase involved in cell wall biosynthesis
MNITEPPFVSIIIPCRNEEMFIGAVLNNVIDQDYPKDRLEVFVVDGISTDKTKSVAGVIAVNHPFIHVLDNPHKTVPYALNIAIQQIRGEVVIRMDAHSEYPSYYISSLVKNLFDLNADNVGGMWITQPGDSTSIAAAIAAATSHPFGIGNAAYRLGASAPKQVDTVPFGCYRKEVFDRIGLFDTQLVRNQDDEFNSRLIKSGGKIFLIPSIEIKYYARENISKLSRMFYQYGLFKPLVNLKLKYPSSVRQLIPPLFLSSLLLAAFLSIFYHEILFLVIAEMLVYILLVLNISTILAIRKGYSVFIPLLLVFPSIHFSYGFGYLEGILRFSIFKMHKQNNQTKIEISR